MFWTDESCRRTAEKDITAIHYWENKVAILRWVPEMLEIEARPERDGSPDTPYHRRQPTHDHEFLEHDRLRWERGDGDR